MDFGAIEIEIAAFLNTKIVAADIEIIPIPEEDVEIKPAYGKRKVIVAFASEEADPDENTSVVSQDVNITFSILLQGKLLRGDAGVYPLAEAVKLALTGFTPTDCRKLTYSSHRFVKNENKIFEYVLDFKTISTRVEDADDETSNVLFKSATYIPIPEI